MYDNLREKYPQTYYINFVSSSESVTMADSHTSAWSYLRSLTSVSDEPENRDLVPVSSLKNLISNRPFLFRSATIIAIDGKISGDNSTISAIEASQSSSGAVEPQSNFKNAAFPVIFQPNYCRPSIKINNSIVNSGLLDGPDNDSKNKGFLGFGVPLNTKLDFGIEFEKGITSIDIDSACALYENSTGKFLNYPLYMILEFWGK